LPGGDLVDEDTGEVSKIPANVQSAKLKGLLNQIKSNAG
jgi:hypothetical protein